jgi:GNAT superfamily N-acetyltransferase
MPESEFTVITPLDRPDYRDLIGEVVYDVWPEFMLNDEIGGQYWSALFTEFAEYQFALLNQAGVIAAFANSAPLRWTEPLEELPDDGWDWAMIQSAADRVEGNEPTALCGLQIAVTPDYQRHGLSRVMLDHMVGVARSHGLPQVVIPVRPSMKSRYPLTPIERYITWQREDGLPFDPWLRVHVRSGGRIVKPCTNAMRIDGSVTEWEAWTDIRFPESGDYIVPGALTPVHMDVEQDTGLYVEPNVWVVHEVADADQASGER